MECWQARSAACGPCVRQALYILHLRNLGSTEGLGTIDSVAELKALFQRSSISNVVKMVQRLTYRRRHCYNSKSNQTRIVKTPGAPPSLI